VKQLMLFKSKGNSRTVNPGTSIWIGGGLLTVTNGASARAAALTRDASAQTTNKVMISVRVAGGENIPLTFVAVERVADCMVGCKVRNSAAASSAGFAHASAGAPLDTISPGPQAVLGSQQA
jgi:hypothetical protein